MEVPQVRPGQDARAKVSLETSTRRSPWGSLLSIRQFLALAQFRRLADQSPDMQHHYRIYSWAHAALRHEVNREAQRSGFVSGVEPCRTRRIYLRFRELHVHESHAGLPTEWHTPFGRAVSSGGKRPTITLAIVEVVVDMPVETIRPAIPGPVDENAAWEPLGP